MRARISCRCLTEVATKTTKGPAGSEPAAEAGCGGRHRQGEELQQKPARFPHAQAFGGHSGFEGEKASGANLLAKKENEAKRASIARYAARQRADYLGF